MGGEILTMAFFGIGMALMYIAGVGSMGLMWSIHKYYGGGSN